MHGGQLPNSSMRRLQRTSARKFDAIVVGSGIAGLLSACEMDARGLRVLLLCKGSLCESNSTRAQGGMAAVTGDNLLDSTEQHLLDTLKSGAGLTDPAAAKMIIESGGRLVARLQESGVSFDRTGGKLDLALEGGHSRSRILHRKDSSGRAITEALIDMVLQCKRLVVREHCFVSELLIRDGSCVGVRVLNAGAEPTDISARHVVLATGGLGRVYDRTTNPDTATGDGIAIAFLAGAVLADMEFVQFHPTSLAVQGFSTLLISEAVRGAGAILLDKHGERFAFRFSANGELGTRDVVAHAIHTTMLEQNSNCVWLDLRPIGSSKILHQFPMIVSACQERGIDPLRQPVPVAPAAHYFMGGILTDYNGATTVPGLYAIGECASTGLHGANRLASNSLLEGGVMALRLADFICGQVPEPLHPPRKTQQHIGRSAPEDCSAEGILFFRRQMSRAVGLVRQGDTLLEFLRSRNRVLRREISGDRHWHEAANIALLGELIASCALRRCESRGAHFRQDYPRRDDAHYLQRSYVSLHDFGWFPVGSAARYELV